MILITFGERCSPDSSVECGMALPVSNPGRFCIPVAAWSPRGARGAQRGQSCRRAWLCHSGNSGAHGRQVYDRYWVPWPDPFTSFIAGAPGDWGVLKTLALCCSLGHSQGKAGRSPEAPVTFCQKVNSSLSLHHNTYVIYLSPSRHTDILSSYIITRRVSILNKIFLKRPHSHNFYYTILL